MIKEEEEEDDGEIGRRINDDGAYGEVEGIKFTVGCLIGLIKLNTINYIYSRLKLVCRLFILGKKDWVNFDGATSMKVRRWRDLLDTQCIIHS